MTSSPVQFWRRRRTPEEQLAPVVPPVAVDDPRSPAERAAISPFDDDRSLHDKQVYSACYSPQTSMFFDQHGDVRACCHNITGVLGNIRLSSIREIWDGAQISSLRAALAERDFSEGCQYCEWQCEQGGSEIAFLRTYDAWPVESRAPTWPSNMELSLTNACNLQCTMCTGWNSSAIRAKREKLPPLPKVYGDEFFEELAEFLPHLDRLTILGGEPLLGAESLRVLSMISEMDRKPAVHLITNATQWSPRVERLLKSIPMGMQLSIDGATKETYETIRIGAVWEDVLENIRRYRDVVHGHGEEIGLSFTLTATNWHELPDIFEFSRDEGLDYVRVTPVVNPRAHSLFRFDVEELTRVVEQLEARVEEMASGLGAMEPVLRDQVEALRNRVTDFSDDDASPVPLSVPWRSGDWEMPDRARAELHAWQPDEEPIWLRGDGDQSITEVGGPIQEQLGMAPTELIGRPMPVFLELVGAAHDASFAPTTTSSDLANEVAFVGIRNGQEVARLRSFLFHDGGDLVAIFAVRATDPVSG